MWPSPTPFTALKSNPSATTNPLPSNDNTQGYVVGSFWVNTTSVPPIYFVASSVATSAAVWTPVLPVGTTSGTVAAGNDSRILNALQAGNNLSDVSSVVTSRANLGLGTAAVANIGTTSGTVAAGNDTRIVGAAQTSNNLSDLSSAATARTNLGLGGAATENVGTSPGTVAAGNDSRITGAIQSGSAASGDLSGTLPNPTVVNTHLTAPLPLGQGGTGSVTQNFVDLTTPQTIAGVKTFSSSPTVPTPTNPGDAATKGYADGISAGITIKTAVVAATTTTLPANTYNNGSSGIGATLTANAVGTLTIDSHTPVLNDRVLIKNEAAAANNGIYSVTTVGNAGAAYVLTRTTDNDTSALIQGAAVFVSTGTVNQGSGWAVVGGPFTVGTTAVNWTQFSSPGLVNVGVGLTQVGNTISLTTPVSASNLPSATTSALGIVKLDGTATDIQPLGTQSAGATGFAADAGHIHPTTNVVLQSAAAGSVVSQTVYGQSPVIGTDLTYAREDHDHGTPSLTTVAPATTEMIGTSSAVGVSSLPARADHVHPMGSAATPGNSAVTDSAATGNSTSFSASNHVHGREGFGTPTTTNTYGLSAVTGTAATVSHSDHTHGTPSLTSTAPSTTEAIGTAASLGSATTPALADHVHPMAAAGTPTNSAVTDTAVTGNATTFSASNHVHGREGFGAVTAETTYGLATSNGTATTVSHSDHTHGTPSLATSAPSTTEAIGTAAVLGTATTPAKADHVHPMASAGTPGNSTVTDVAATGSSTNFSAADHVHGREGFGSVTPLTTFGASSANGSATTVSHSDHAHGSPSLPVATTGVEGIVQLAGDLGGTAASPSVLKINGVTVSGTPAYGNGIKASTSTTAAWGLLPDVISTGLLSGGVMTQDGSILNAFDLSAGVGFISDYVTSPASPTVSIVNISAQTVTLSGGALTNVVNYWYADSSGTIHNQSTALTSPQKRQNIFLGSTWSTTGTGNLYAILNNPILLNQTTANINALFEALGGLNISGNVVSANGANLNINKTAGTIHGAFTNYAFGGANNPFLLATPAETAATFRYVTQLSNSQSAPRTTLDVANFDNGGTITALAANNDAAVHRVYLIPTGVAGSQIIIQYGQLQYTALASTVPGFLTEVFVPCPDLGTRATLIGYIAAVKNATQLNNAAQATFIPAFKFSNP